MTGAQNRLIHELVEQSRDRVTHVRAGQSLLDVLGTQHDRRSSHLPPPAASALHRPHHTTHAVVSDASGIGARTRKRATVLLSDTPTSSYSQYADYAGSKLPQRESVHMLERRKAVLPTSTPLTKLVSRVGAKQVKENVKDSVAAKLIQTVAVVKGCSAYLRVKDKDHFRLPAITNTHLAFVDFQSPSPPIPHALAGAGAGAMSQLNAATREPIRFGDPVCLLSLVANVPLAINRHGRTMAVTDAVTGPHMIFTVVDFGNPSRRDDVLMGEAFWLRVDAGQLEMGETDEILALLMDTHYYLGGPGPKEEGEDAVEEERPQGAAYKYAIPHSSSDHTFKLVTMKATVPSAEYYGDDAATREYTTETNANILRLAKWRFRSLDPSTSRRRGHATGSDGESTREGEDQLVLNCATVGLQLDAFTLEYDATRRRGVLWGSLARTEVSQQSSTAVRLSHRKTCVWQVRLMRRGEPPPSSQSSSGEPKSPTDKQSLAWLQAHHDRVERDTRFIDAKRMLAQNAHAAYDNVAIRSNTKLLQIESSKAAHHHTYFQRRAQQVMGKEEVTNKTVQPQLCD